MRGLRNVDIIGDLRRVSWGGGQSLMGEGLRENGRIRKSPVAAIVVIIDLGKSHQQGLKPWSVRLLGSRVSQSVTPI